MAWRYSASNPLLPRQETTPFAVAERMPLRLSVRCSTTLDCMVIETDKVSNYREMIAHSLTVYALGITNSTA